MNCPTCNIQLILSDRQGVEINYCPTCRGVWVDPGGLDKIIDRSMSNVPGTEFSGGARESHRANRYQEHERGHRKSFFSDLFD